jgi:DNA-binding beta-propeller fold protein YncE
MRLLPLLVLALVPCAAVAQGTASAASPPAASPVEEEATGVGPSMAHARAEKTIADLMPHLVIHGGYYSGQFEIVAGVYCDRRTGEMYVADQGANSIEIFSETGAPLFAFSDDEHLSGPVRVAVDHQDRIHVIDSDHSRIKVFDYRGEFLSYLVPPGFEGQECSFTAITFEDNGDMWVGESLSGQVVGYDRNMRPKLRIGRHGEGPEEFSTIVGIALSQSNVYVASQQGVAVQVFSRVGRFLRGWGYHDAGLHNVSLPAGIAVDSSGRVILLDTLRQEVKYFDPRGALIGLFAGLGRHAGAVAYPTDLSMDRRGRLCVADSGNQRAQVLLPVEAPPTGDARQRRQQQREAARPQPPVSAR